jgi:hypothetical protein
MAVLENQINFLNSHTNVKQKQQAQQMGQHGIASSNLAKSHALNSQGVGPHAHGGLGSQEASSYLGPYQSHANTQQQTTGANAANIGRSTSFYGLYSSNRGGMNNSIIINTNNQMQVNPQSPMLNPQDLQQIVEYRMKEDQHAKNLRFDCKQPYLNLAKRSSHDESIRNHRYLQAKNRNLFTNIEELDKCVSEVNSRSEIRPFHRACQFNI